MVKVLLNTAELLSLTSSPSSQSLNRLYRDADIATRALGARVQHAIPTPTAVLATGVLVRLHQGFSCRGIDHL